MRVFTPIVRPLVTALLVVAAAVAPAAANQRSINAQLAEVRAATARFHDVAVAEAAGYVQVSPCIVGPGGAGMGAHWVKGQLVDDVLEPTQPEALLYAPTTNGWRLVGVEYLATDPDARLFGQAFHVGPSGPALHAWVWQANPDGAFADFNRNVSC